MRIDAAAVWSDYAEHGKTIGVIAAERRISFGAVHAILKQHPGYAALAAERRRHGPDRSRAETTKPFDLAEALELLAAGATLRSIAARFGVSATTARKRMKAVPAYAKLVSGRQGSRSNTP